MHNINAHKQITWVRVSPPRSQLFASVFCSASKPGCHILIQSESIKAMGDTPRPHHSPLATSHNTTLKFYIPPCPRFARAMARASSTSSVPRQSFGPLRCPIELRSSTSRISPLLSHGLTSSQAARSSKQVRYCLVKSVFLLPFSREAYAQTDSSVSIPC